MSNNLSRYENDKKNERKKERKENTGKFSKILYLNDIISANDEIICRIDGDEHIQLLIRYVM